MVGWCSWLSHLVNNVNSNTEKVLGSSPSLIIHFCILLLRNEIGMKSAIYIFSVLINTRVSPVRASKAGQEGKHPMKGSKDYQHRSYKDFLISNLDLKTYQQ
jgi:hypothetical protein